MIGLYGQICRHSPIFYAPLHGTASHFIGRSSHFIGTAALRPGGSRVFLDPRRKMGYSEKNT